MATGRKNGVARNRSRGRLGKQVQAERGGSARGAFTRRSSRREEGSS